MESKIVCEACGNEVSGPDSESVKEAAERHTKAKHGDGQ